MFSALFSLISSACCGRLNTVPALVSCLSEFQGSELQQDLAGSLNSEFEINIVGIACPFRTHASRIRTRDRTPLPREADRTLLRLVFHLYRRSSASQPTTAFFP